MLKKLMVPLFGVLLLITLTQAAFAQCNTAKQAKDGKVSCCQTCCCCKSA